MWGESLAAGKAKRDPALGDLQVITGVPVAIGDDVERLLEFVKPALALYIGGMGARGKNFYNDLAVRYGYEAEAKTIQDLYLDGKKDEAAAAVPIELVRASSLIGPESYVAERIAAFAEAGVSTLMLQPLRRQPVKARLRTVETMKRRCRGLSTRGSRPPAAPQTTSPSSLRREDARAALVPQPSRPGAPGALRARIMGSLDPGAAAGRSDDERTPTGRARPWGPSRSTGPFVTQLGRSAPPVVLLEAHGLAGALTEDVRAVVLPVVVPGHRVDARRGPPRSARP